MKTYAMKKIYKMTADKCTKLYRKSVTYVMD